jgi:formylglycine-generating enzyme required for sulfatase activity
MADIFVSYKREDRGKVEMLVRLLEAQSFAVWWDPSIVPGERFAAVIRRALEEASCVVVMWSDLSVDSLWVQDEAGFARDRHKLVPISLDGIDPPLGFRQLQTVNLSDWTGQADDARIERFLAGVRRMVDVSREGKPAEHAVAALSAGRRDAGPARQTQSPAVAAGVPSRWRSKRMLVVAGSIAAVLLTAALIVLAVSDRGQPVRRAALPKGAVPVERSFRDCGAGCPVMVVVPTGSFLMGSFDREPQRGSDEGPQHEVTISKVLAVGKFPVTVDDWEFCVTQGGCPGASAVAKWGRGAHPVINVSWDDAKTYVKWLSRHTGKTYRLLSEAEREYITRAGTTTPFWWGATISSDQANYDGTQRYTDEPPGHFRGQTVPVDSFSPNPWGFYSVHGNSWEWVEDCYYDSYEGAPSDGTARTGGDCSRRVLRGGSWASQPRNLRSAARYRLGPEVRGDWYGFRVARTCATDCNF